MPVAHSLECCEAANLRAVRDNPSLTVEFVFNVFSQRFRGVKWSPENNFPSTEDDFGHCGAQSQQWKLIQRGILIRIRQRYEIWQFSLSCPDSPDPRCHNALRKFAIPMS